MLYVSGEGFDSLTVSDSDSGESFRVTKSLAKNRWAWQLEDGRPFNITKVLGYCEGYVGVVSKHLIPFLGVVSSIDYMTDGSKDAFYVHRRDLRFRSECNILCVVSLKVYNILDMVMCASYYDDFEKQLRIGVLQLRVGRSDYFLVNFCGNYMGVVAKLITVYRSSDEFQSKFGGKLLV